jgi:hypothetical protein
VTGLPRHRSQPAGPARLACLSLLFWLGQLFGFPVVAATSLQPGNGSFHYTAPATGKPLTIWYHRPPGMDRTARVVFVMHGQERNAQQYRDRWAAHAARHGFLLLVPEFSAQAFPGTQYGFGGVTDADEKRWGFQVIEALFDEVRAGESLKTPGYTLYGHSAGAQFVHRFMLFMPETRTELAIAANAGAYTLPLYASSTEAGFPWSLDRKLVSEAQLRKALGRRLVVLLGDRDTDPAHPLLPRAPQAKAQGRHRLERGQTFFQTGRDEAASLDTAFRWELHTVPGVAHSDAGMSAAAIAIIFNAPKRGNRGKDKPRPARDR